MLLIFSQYFNCLSSTSRGVSIISFVIILGAPAGIASASFSLVFFF